MTARAPEAGSTISWGFLIGMKKPLYIRPTPRPSDRAAPPRDRVVAGFANRSGDAFPMSRTQRHFLIQIGAAAADYRTGEKAVGTSSLFSCRIGRTPLCGGHAPPGLRDSSPMRARSPRSLYTQVWTNLLSPPSSLVQQAARGESSSRAGTALAHASSTFGISPGA